MFFSKKKTSCFSPFAHHALKKKKKNCNFYFHPRIFCRKKERKKGKIEIKQTLKISFIFVYTIFHPRNGSIHPPHTLPSLRTHKTKRNGMDAREQSKKRTKASVTEKSWARTFHWIWKAAKLRTGFPNSSGKYIRRTNENASVEISHPRLRNGKEEF